MIWSSLKSTKAGFGLIEAMIAGAVIAGLALAVGEMINYTNKSVKSSGLSSDWVNLTNNMRLAFSNTTTCSQTFGTASGAPIVFPGTPPASPANLDFVAVPTLAANTNPPSAPITFLTVGATVAGFQASRLRLVVSALNSTPRETVTLSTIPQCANPAAPCYKMIISLDMIANKMVGASTSQVVQSNSAMNNSVSFTAYVDPTNNSIVQCFGSEDSVQVGCESLGGTYDISKTPNCQLAFLPVGLNGTPQPPSVTTGERLQLWSGLGTTGIRSTNDISIGIEGNSMWFNSGGGGGEFKFYNTSGTNALMRLNNGGLTITAGGLNVQTGRLQAANGITLSQGTGGVDSLYVGSGHTRFDGDVYVGLGGNSALHLSGAHGGNVPHNCHVNPVDTFCLNTEQTVGGGCSCDDTNDRLNGCKPMPPNGWWINCYPSNAGAHFTVICCEV